MTITLAVDGQMACEYCDTIYGHPVVLDHPTMSARIQLRQAASRAGWRQTSAGLDVCCDCAQGMAAILIPGFAVWWLPEYAVPVSDEDAASTVTIPAVLQDSAA